MIELTSQQTQFLPWSERIQSYYIYKLFEFSASVDDNDYDDTGKMLVNMEQTIPQASFKSCASWLSAIRERQSVGNLKIVCHDKLLAMLLSSTHSVAINGVLKIKMVKNFSPVLFFLPTIFWLYLNAIFQMSNESPETIEIGGEPTSFEHVKSAFIAHHNARSSYPSHLEQCRAWFACVIRVLLTTHTDFFSKIFSKNLLAKIETDSACIRNVVEWAPAYKNMCQRLLYDDTDRHQTMSYQVNLHMWCPHNITIRFVCNRQRVLQVTRSSTIENKQPVWTLVTDLALENGIVLTKTLCIPHHVRQLNDDVLMLYALFFNCLYTTNDEDLYFLNETNFLTARKRCSTVRRLGENYTLWDVIPPIVVNRTLQIGIGNTFEFDFSSTVLSALKIALNKKSHACFSYSSFDTTKKWTRICVEQQMGSFQCTPFECGVFYRASDPNKYCLIVRHAQTVDHLTSAHVNNNNGVDVDTFHRPCPGFLFWSGQEDVVCFSVVFKDIFKITVYFY